MIRIGPLQVDLACRAVWLDGESIRLGSRAFDILAVLASAEGALVSKNELMRLVWPDVIVEENNLQVHMSALRKALGENRGLVQTVSGRGYRLARAQTFDHDDHHPTAHDTSRDIVHNLPCNGSTLIGRESAIGDIAQALEASRHVTLVGAGGIGKTRLAVEAARALLPSFPDGVYLVPLASAADAPGVLAALTGVLGVSPSTGTLTAARIAKELGERRMLVVLDNCEHVIGPAAELAEALAGASGDTRVLATSREPLRVVNERVYWVASLDVPEESVEHEAVLRSSAVQLFLTRARSFDARFSSDDRSLHLTGTVCRRLDGIPLAIELAAARAAVLGIETLAAHLDDRFALLTGGNRTALPRHQTLKATLDWSHALLDEAERTTLRRLGIFANGFTMEAAIAVVQDNSLREFDVIAALSGLVEKSLVVTQVTGGAASYRLLETTRAYALQKLDDNGERRAITLAHARYFASLLDFVDDDARPSEASWQRDRRDVLDDLRAAFVWALSSNGDARIGEKLAVKFLTLLFELSLVDECCMWARRWLDQSDGRDEQVRMRVQAALAASLVYVHGPDQETRALWSAVLSSAIALGDRSFEARALWGMWNACQSAGEVKSALSFARRFAALAAENGHEHATDVLLGHRLMGIAWTYAGEQDKARASLDRFMPHTRGMRQRLPLGRSIDQRVVGGATLSRVLWLQGERERALALAESCAAEAIEQQQAIVTCYVLIEAWVPLALLSTFGDHAARAVHALTDVAARAGLKVAQACARAFSEYLHSFDEPSPERLQAYRAALDDLESLGFEAPRAMLVAQYACALGRAGRREDALAEAERALERCASTGDRWFESELVRIRGELLSDTQWEDAQACFATALDIASKQGCRSLQLRAATSLARSWHRQGRYADAVSVLSTVCESIQEGREWNDYRAAQALLMRSSEEEPAACD